MGGVSPPLTYTHCVVWDGAYFVFVTSRRTDPTFYGKKETKKQKSMRTLN